MVETVLDTTSQEWILSQEEACHFNQLRQRFQEAGQPMVLWGWKRDRVTGGRRYPESRTVYFSADLKEVVGKIQIERAFFFLETRAREEDINILRGQIGESDVVTYPRLGYEGYARMRMALGEPTDYDWSSVRRRLKGKPRITIAAPRLLPLSLDYDISSFAPFAFCAGSGLSAESGLPLLGSIHSLFEVDNMETGELIFGANDTLPKRIISDPEGEFRKFCQFTIDAIKAIPSDSHRIIAKLYEQGVIRGVFTDNMDDILGKLNVPYTKTRLSIFPDRFPVEFDPEVKSLLVVGVAVDRRDVIKQARKAGLKIIAINPVDEVAPHSRNMDYLSDIFFRQTAAEALPRIIAASGF